MVPATLALIDDDRAFSEYLAQFLSERGIAVSWYADGDALLAGERPYDFAFYIVDLLLPDIDGLSLLRALRARTDAGVLVVSGKVGAEVFGDVIGAGADMHLAKPATFEQILLAVTAVYRRASPPGLRQDVWQLREDQSTADRARWCRDRSQPDRPAGAELSG